MHQGSSNEETLQTFRKPSTHNAVCFAYHETLRLISNDEYPSLRFTRENATTTKTMYQPYKDCELHFHDIKEDCTESKFFRHLEFVSEISEVLPADAYLFLNP